MMKLTIAEFLEIIQANGKYEDYSSMTRTWIKNSVEIGLKEANRIFYGNNFKPPWEEEIQEKIDKKLKEKEFNENFVNHLKSEE